MDQLEKVSVFDLETYNKEEYATPYAAGIYNANRLHETWKRDLTTDQIGIEETNVIDLMILIEVLSKTCLNTFREPRRR